MLSNEGVELTRDSQDTITSEDLRFRAFLVENGYDTSTMGNTDHVETSIFVKRRRTAAALDPDTPTHLPFSMPIALSTWSSLTMSPS